LTEAGGANGTAEEGGASEVDREQAKALLEDGAQLVDVRVAHEWDAGHIPGATHLPLEELAERSGELDADRPVVLYCRGGTRSSMAAEALAGAGFNAVKLSEGIVGWDEAGLELDSEQSYVAESGEAASILQARKRVSTGD
jgi:rhodanese-related sulfurtransferase